MEAVFKIDKENSGKWSFLVEGDLTVQCAADFKSKLIEVTECAEDCVLQISLRKATTIDVSAIQLLYATIVLGRKRKNMISVIWPESEEAEALIGRTGFKALLNV